MVRRLGLIVALIATLLPISTLIPGVESPVSASAQVATAATPANDVVSSSVASESVRLASGGAHTCAIFELGTLKCWGWNFYGQLGNGTNTRTITLTSSDDIALLATSSATAVIGMRLTTDIVAGSPLTPSQLISVKPLTSTEGLAGITVTKSQAPANLAAGDNVQVIAVDSQSDGSNLTTPISTNVQVWEISEPDELSGDRSVTLRVAITSANELVGHDELHLVKVVN